MLVYEMVPGVSYTVENSETLTAWNEEFTLYGLGQIHRIPMFDIPASGQAPPPPPSGTVQVPMISLTLKTSSAPEGGLLLSWASRVDGQALKTVIPGSLHPNWANHPISFHHTEEFDFFVFYTGQSELPPALPPSVGTMDQAMIDSFESALEVMNLEMETGMVSSGSSSVAGAQPSGIQEFWRVTADWSLDSDSDGTLDWMEFALAADTDHPFNPLGDAFGSDVDLNGVADGEETDSDGDGVFNTWEPVAGNDKVADWNKLPQPRYAGFIFDGPVPAAGQSNLFPHQVNDQGMALFSNQVWWQGVSHSLTLEGPTIAGCRALGMNNLGQIIGVGTPTNVPAGPPNGAVALPGVALAWWDSYLAVPMVVEIAAEDPADVVHSYSVWPDAPAADFPFDSLLDDQGQFIGLSTGVNHPQQTSVWKRSGVPAPAAPFQLVEAPSDTVLYRFSIPEGLVVPGEEGPGWSWGPGEAGTELFKDGEIDPEEFAATATKVALRPSNRMTALFGKDVPLWGQLPDNTWIESPKLPKSIDCSLSGVFIRNQFSLWLNGYGKNLGAVAYGVPDPWNDAPGHFDLSPTGWLAGRKIGAPDAGVPTFVGMPVVLEDDVYATGVDYQSADTWNPDKESQGRYWLMVPIGTDPVTNQPLSNDVRFLTPATPAAPITLSAPGIIFDPDTLTGPDQLVTVTANLPETEDIDVTLSLANASASSFPVGVKAMKPRTVKLTVWHIARLDMQTGVADAPELIFREGPLKEYLDGLFAPQVNITWEIDVRGDLAPDGVNWDIGDAAGFGPGIEPQQGPTAGNGNFDIGSDGTGPEQERVANANRTEPSADINAYIIGGLKAGENFHSWGRDETGAFGRQGFDSKGTTNVTGRKFFINGTSKNSSEADLEFETARMLNTIAHEIGHVMLDAGHPNVNITDQTTHPLPGSYSPDRLMYVWPFAPATAKRKLLVKGEWDEIENWLQENVDD